MSRERGDQPTRRTVAELLQEHGAKPADAPRRRHRRREPDDESGENELTTTAPQAIIDRINAEMTNVDSPTRRNGGPHSHAVPDEAQAPPAATPPAPQPPPVRPAPQQPPQPQQPQQPPAGSGYNRAAPPPSAPSWPAMPQPKQEQPTQPPPPPQQGIDARLDGHAAPQQAPRQRPQVEDSTDQMPAVDLTRQAGYGYVEDYEDDYDYQDEYDYDESYQQGYPSGYQGAAEQDDYDYVEDYEHDYEDAYPGGYDRGYAAPPGPGDPDGHGPTSLMAPVGAREPARDAEFDVDTEEPAAGKEWLAVAAQLTMGVVGGAGVWLLFNWLWMQIPALALGAALVVVVGLVWIVRKIRKAEDMQTTVLAVLVGVVVTVSPAALLLLDK